MSSTTNSAVILKMKSHRLQQRSEEWFRARAGRITGSRFSRAMAVRTSDTYQGLISELADERRTGRCGDRGYVNRAMQWGIDHEAGARSWYIHHRGRSVREVGFVVHPLHEFVGVSPDGLVGENGLIEIKCPQMKGFRQVVSTQKMPSRYRWQVQGQLWVCQRDWLDFVCFYPPGQGVVVHVPADEDDFDQIEARCIEINREVCRRVGIGFRAAAISRPGHTTPQAVAPEERSRSVPPRASSSNEDIPAWVWIVAVLITIIWLAK